MTRDELERITGVALRLIEDGMVSIATKPAPNRHHNLFELGDDPAWHMADQGFWTSHNRFVDRLEAMTIAKAAGQFKRRKNPGDYDGPELFSEDLW